MGKIILQDIFKHHSFYAIDKQSSIPIYIVHFNTCALIFVDEQLACANNIMALKYMSLKLRQKSKELTIAARTSNLKKHLYSNANSNKNEQCSHWGIYPIWQ